MSDSALVLGPLEATVRSLEAMILDDFELGQSLPSEHDLAASLEVSRLTVREALKVLSGRGLVDLGRGRRPVVKAADPSVLSGYLAAALRRDPRGLLELGQVRQALEVLSASSAARQANRAALSAVEAAITEMESTARQLDEELEQDGTSAADGSAGQALPGADKGLDARLQRYNEADLRFHEALALASGNRMLAFLLESLGDCLAESFRASASGHFVRGGSVRAVAAAHRAILDAVAAGDADGAARAMRSHLTAAERDLRAALVGRPGPFTRGGER